MNFTVSQGSSSNNRKRPPLSESKETLNNSGNPGCFESCDIDSYNDTAISFSLATCKASATFFCFTGLLSRPWWASRPIGVYKDSW